MMGSMVGHTDGINAMDWSKDGTKMRTTSSDFELIYWTIDNTGEDPVFDQDVNGPHSQRAVEWATDSVKLGWNI